MAGEISHAFAEACSFDLPTSRCDYDSLPGYLHEPEYLHDFHRALVDFTYVDLHRGVDAHIIVVTKIGRLVGYLGKREGVTYIMPAEKADKYRSRGLYVLTCEWTGEAISDLCRSITLCHASVDLAILDPVGSGNSSGLTNRSLAGQFDLERYGRIYVCWNVRNSPNPFLTFPVFQYFWNPYARLRDATIFTRVDPSRGEVLTSVCTGQEMYDIVAFAKLSAWSLRPDGVCLAQNLLDHARRRFFRVKDRVGSGTSQDPNELTVRHFCQRNRLGEPRVYTSIEVDETTRVPVYRAIGVLGGVCTTEWISGDDETARGSAWADLKESLIPSTS